MPARSGCSPARADWRRSAWSARCAGRATLGDGADLAFTDGNFSDRIGWREITVAGDRTTVTGTDVPASSVSDRLLAYPTDGRSPLRLVGVDATVEPGGPALASGRRRRVRRTERWRRRPGAPIL